MKILKIIVGIILVVLGLQGLYSQTVNGTHDIIATSINLALAVLGAVLLYKAVSNKPKVN